MFGEEGINNRGIEKKKLLVIYGYELIMGCINVNQRGKA